MWDGQMWEIYKKNAEEPVIRVPKMSRGKSSRARGIHCCPNSFLFHLPHYLLYIEKNMCVCIHICDCVQTVCKLPLLPNSTTHPLTQFCTNREQWEVLTGYLSLGRRSVGDWANTWRWSKRFRTFLPNKKYRGADKSLARPRKKQATATEDFDVHISYL